jgi:serine/threonine protein kinase
MNNPLRFILIISFYAVMFACSAANAYLTFATPYLNSTSGWGHKREGDSMVVGYVYPYGPVGELREGDEIVALNGREFKSGADKSKFFSNAEVGKPYTLLVRRDGRLRELTLRTVPISNATWASFFLETIISPSLFLIVGLAVFLLKPNDEQALLLSLIFACLVLSPSTMGAAPRWLQVVMSAAFVVSGFMFPLFLHFSLIFPEPSGFTRKLLRSPALLYLPALVFILPSHATDSYLRSVAPDMRDSVTLSLFVKVATAIQLLYVIGGLTILALKYKHSGQVARRKLRVLQAGTIIGVAPTLIVITASLFVEQFTIMRTLGEWHWVIIPLATLLVPLSFAYAIVRHQVIPVSLIIRRSLQYLLAKNALRLLLALPLIGLALSVIANRDRNLSDILLRNSIYFYLLLLAALAVGLFFRKRLTEWIDRKFFREAYSQEKILRELIDDVKRLDSISEMSRRVTEQVIRALHPEQVYLFYRAENARALSLSYTSGGAGEEIKIPEDFQLLRFMEMQGGAQAFPFPQKNNLPASEKDWLDSLGTQLTGGEVDERSDLFSVGVMVAEALTGRRPFPGKTYTELLTNILQHSFHLPVNSAEARGLDGVLQKALAKERASRFASASEMQAALIPALRRCPQILQVNPLSAEADTFILN